MKKLVGLVVSLLVMANSMTVMGADSNYAYSFGTNYSKDWYDYNIDTSHVAKDASTDFGIAGYDSRYNIKPTVQYMRGDNPDTHMPRMESEILFFDGHGNSQCVAFNYKKKDGDYKTGIFYGEDYDSLTSGYKFAGIRSCNFSKVKLVTFAGCKTAEGTDNITIRAIDEGAETAVGWEKSVGTRSFTRWLSRYTNELALGKSVKEAVDYANGFTYTDNNVKTVVIKGNEDLVIMNSKDKATFSINNDKLGEKKSIENRDEILNIEELKEIDINIDLSFDSEKADYSNIVTFISDKSSTQFNIDDYNIYLTERNNNSSIIDLIYKIGDFETNSSYTVFVENKKVVKIIDNTIKIDKQPITNNKTVCEQYSIQKNTENPISDEYLIEEQESKYYYNINNNKHYNIVLLTLKHVATNTLVKVERFYEIK